MKRTALQLLISFSLASALSSLAQTNVCVSSNISNKLICLVPDSGTILTNLTFGATGQNAAAEQNAAFGAATSINAAVAAQLAQLPIPSATVGALQIKRKGSDVPLPFTNLGPVLTDRPDTVGRGHLFSAFGFQHFNFNALDGQDLKNLPLAFTFADTITQNSQPKIHYGAMTNTVDLQLDQYIFLATAGVSPTTDLSIIIPVNSISVNVVSGNFQAYDYDINSQTYSVHSPPAKTSLLSRGSASGLGDITVGLKQMLLGQEHNRPAAAVGATFRFPTGDAYNYLGSGALGGSLYGLLEYRARLAPHMKVGYQWNDTTKILSPTLQSGSARLPGGLSYAIGTDFRIHPKLTLNADFLGNQFVNTPTFHKTTSPLNPVPQASSGLTITTFDVVSTVASTYTTVNFSGGLKWQPFPHAVIYGNALIALSNVGLRSEVVPVVGIAYNFHREAR